MTCFSLESRIRIGDDHHGKVGVIMEGFSLRAENYTGRLVHSEMDDAVLTAEDEEISVGSDGSIWTMQGQRRAYTENDNEVTLADVEATSESPPRLRLVGGGDIVWKQVPEIGPGQAQEIGTRYEFDTERFENAAQILAYISRRINTDGDAAIEMRFQKLSVSKGWMHSLTATLNVPVDITIRATGEQFYVVQHLHASTTQNPVGSAWCPNRGSDEDRDQWAVRNTALPDTWRRVVVEEAMKQEDGPNNPGLVFAYECCEFLKEKGYSPVKETLSKEEQEKRILALVGEYGYEELVGRRLPFDRDLVPDDLRGKWQGKRDRY